MNRILLESQESKRNTVRNYRHLLKKFSISGKHLQGKDSTFFQTTKPLSYVYRLQRAKNIDDRNKIERRETWISQIMSVLFQMRKGKPFVLRAYRRQVLRQINFFSKQTSAIILFGEMRLIHYYGTIINSSIL